MEVLVLALALFDVVGILADCALGLMVVQDRYSRKCLRRLAEMAEMERHWRRTESHRLRFS